MDDAVQKWVKPWRRDFTTVHTSVLFLYIFEIVDDVIVIAHRKQHNTGLGYTHVITHWELERDVVISLKYDKHA